MNLKGYKWIYFFTLVFSFQVRAQDSVGDIVLSSKFTRNTAVSSNFLSYRKPKKQEVDQFLFSLSQSGNSSYPLINCMMKVAHQFELYPFYDWLAWSAQFERFSIKEIELSRQKVSPFFEIQEVLRTPLSHEGRSQSTWKHLAQNTKIYWARWNRQPKVIYELSWYEQKIQMEFYKLNSQKYNRVKVIAKKLRPSAHQSLSPRERMNFSAIECPI